jgi:hypothetical protein
MPSYHDPSISYIGSIEPTNVVGANLFEIIFDSSLTTPFMFEYIIQSDNVLATPGTIIAQDFIYPESAQTTGIVNQWILPIPFTGAYSSLSYDPSQNIMIRVYPENVGPTPWSNALALYNPPKQPTGVTASYPAQAGQIVLSVGIDMSNSDPSPPIQYLAAYYYYSVAADRTQWAVTSPVTPTANYVNNVWVAEYTGPEITDISGNFYVSISGVFPIPGTSPQAYTVSMISSTVVATSSQPGPPLNVDISYNVYTQPNNVSSGPQTMTVNWSNPNGVPTTFTVTNYVVDISANGVGIASYSVAASLNTFTTPAGLLDPYLTANNEIEITVSAIIGGFKYTSTPVNNKNIFVFSPAPTVDQVNAQITGVSTQDINFNITTPANFGVNDAVGTLQWVVYHNYDVYNPSSGAVIDASGTIVSPSTGTTYNLHPTNVSFNNSNTYGIASWVNTEDTNSVNYFQGLYGQSLSVALTLNDVSYNVYNAAIPTDPGAQTMDLTWSAPATTPNYYNVYVDVSGAGFILDTSTNLTNYTYVVSGGLLTMPSTNIAFYIAAVYGSTEYPSNTKSKNIFVYSDAPTVSDVVSLISGITQDISFNLTTPANLGVYSAVGTLAWAIYYNYSDPYNSSTATVVASGFVGPVSPSTLYSIHASGVPYNSTDTFGVVSWVNTRDTNTSNYLQGLYGQSLISSFVLDPVIYNVYNAAFPTAPGPQTMDLTWSPPSSPPDSYTVYVNTGSGFVTDLSGIVVNNYTYTVPGGLLTSNNTISFYIGAIYSGVVYPSNIQSKNVFVYASAPAVDVNWATLIPNSTSPTGIDTQFTVQLQNLPLSLGVNNGVGSLTWAVYHDYNVVVPSTPIIDISGTVLYSEISGGNVYSIFAQCAYHSGDNYGVIAWLNTQDTNSSALLIGEVANHADPIFNEPFIYDVEYNSTTDVLTGYIQSNQPLTRTKNEIHYIGEGAEVLVVPYNIANLVSLGSSAVTIDQDTGVVTTVSVLRVGNNSTTAWLYTITLSNLATLPADLDYWVLNANNGTNGTYNSSQTNPYDPYPA